MSVGVLSGVKTVGTNLAYGLAYTSGGVALLGMVELTRRAFLGVIGESNRDWVNKKGEKLNEVFRKIPSALIPYAKKKKWEDVALNTAAMWLCSSLLLSQLARNGGSMHPILQKLNPLTSRIL